MKLQALGIFVLFALHPSLSFAKGGYFFTSMHCKVGELTDRGIHYDDFDIDAPSHRDKGQQFVIRKNDLGKTFVFFKVDRHHDEMIKHEMTGGYYGYTELFDYGITISVNRIFHPNYSVKPKSKRLAIRTFNIHVQNPKLSEVGFTLDDVFGCKDNTTGKNTCKLPMVKAKLNDETSVTIQCEIKRNWSESYGMKY